MNTRTGYRVRARGGLLALALAFLMLVASPVAAETTTIVDEKGPALQGPAYQLIRGTLTYTRESTVLTARIQRVDRDRTWVGGSVYYADDSALKMFTTYRDGRRVTRGTFTTAGGSQTRVPVTSRWNFARDRVRLIVDNTVDDPKPGNRRAVLDLYTVTKGWNHGPHCGTNPDGSDEICNDDYVAARLRR